MPDVVIPYVIPGIPNPGNPGNDTRSFPFPGNEKTGPGMQTLDTREFDIMMFACSYLITYLSDHPHRTYLLTYQLVHTEVTYLVCLSEMSGEV